MFNSRFMPDPFFNTSSLPARPTRRRVVSYMPASPVQDEVEKAFNGLFTQMMAPWAGLNLLNRVRNGEETGLLMPRLDVTSDEKAYTITAELPGVAADAVTLEVKENTLVIKGEKKQECTKDDQDMHVCERSYGSFERMLSLPEDAAVDSIKAAHKDGVLTITVPRKEPEQAQTKTIAIDKE